MTEELAEILSTSVADVEYRVETGVNTEWITLAVENHLLCSRDILGYHVDRNSLTTFSPSSSIP